ncbi:MAG: dihydrodipicolinate synthase family protein [Nocardioides sp.]
MTSSPWPTGLMTALVTPLADDELDEGALALLIDRQVAAGVSGLVVGGGTGEYGALGVDERQRLAVAAIGTAAGRVPVVIQTGCLTTRDAVRLSRHAEASGADAIMVASPFGEAISWRERVRFYEVLTSEISLPTMIYNTPPSGLLTFEQVLELAELPHISAVKDSSGSPELMGDLVEHAATQDDFAVYVGLDSLLYDAVATGARGAVFGAANIIPGPLSAVARSVREDGPTPRSRELWASIRLFLRHMERSPNYVALCKAGLNHQGLSVGDVRMPYLMPDHDEVRTLAVLLEDVEKAYAAWDDGSS